MKKGRPQEIVLKFGPIFVISHLLLLNSFDLLQILISFHWCHPLEGIVWEKNPIFKGLGEGIPKYNLFGRVSKTSLLSRLVFLKNWGRLWTYRAPAKSHRYNFLG